MSKYVYYDKEGTLLRGLAASEFPEIGAEILFSKAKAWEPYRGFPSDIVAKAMPISEAEAKKLVKEEGGTWVI